MHRNLRSITKTREMFHPIIRDQDRDNIILIQAWGTSYRMQRWQTHRVGASINRLTLRLIEPKLMNTDKNITQEIL